MNLTDAIRAWLDTARTDGRPARSTLKQWQSWLRRLARRLGPDATIDDFNATKLRAEMLALAKANLRPRTVRCGIFAWRAFGRWLVATGRAEANPAMELRAPRLDHAQRERCTDQDVQELLAACERIADDRRAAMARAIVTVFAFAGLRRRECLNLRVGDLNLRERSLVVNLGKGGKNRKAFVPQEYIGALGAWLRVRGECRHDGLWAGYDASRRLGDEGLRVLIRELQAIAGHKGSRALLPHGIRHAYATRLARNGVELDAIREALGHTSIQTTAIYLHTEEERLREVSELAGFVRKEEVRGRKAKKATPEGGRFRRHQLHRGE